MGTILSANNIVKEFPGVRALDNVTFDLQERQIHALCGENGAGKSTLIKVLIGEYPHHTYEGKILLDDKEVVFETINDSKQLGIAVIHQELSLFNDLSVAENLFVGQEINKRNIIQWDSVYAEAKKWLARMKLDDVAPTERVGSLGVGKQQLIEIARALIASEIRILILDEPTASLTENETGLLMDILRQLREDGTSVIYISHKLEEVMQIADYVTVLRDGATVGGGEIKNFTQQDIVQMMVGRKITDMYPARENRQIGDVIYELKDCSVHEYVTEKALVTDASVKLRRGEILGMFGLVGAGRTELMSSAYGQPDYRFAGEVLMGGRKLDVKTPLDSISAGVAYCTEDRKNAGIIPLMDIRENITLSFIKNFHEGLSINSPKEVIAAREQVADLNVRPPTLETKVVNLSGGNQQKVLLARTLVGDIKVLILDEPTRGIDVGAKQEIYEIMKKLADNGTSIIMISSELPEILGMCDRIVVMHNGSIKGEFDNTDKSVTQEMIMMQATGLHGGMEQ